MRFVGYKILIGTIIIFIFYGNIDLINIKKLILIDNKINESLYQKDEDFSHFETQYKILAIFYPENINFENDFFEKNKTLSPEKKENNYNVSFIEKQVQIAKNHGIYGFGIVYNLLFSQFFNERIFDYFLIDNKINFPFFIILKYKFKSSHQNKNLFTENLTYNEKNLNFFIEKIKKYSISKNYIRLRGKPILGFINSSFSSSQLLNYIREYQIKDIDEKFYIIDISFENINLNYSTTKNFKIEFPSQNIGLKNELNQQYFYDFYYYNLIIKDNIKSKDINDFSIINGSHPEKFYFTFMKYLNLTIYNNNSFLLFNAWNDYEQNFILQPTKELGFLYLNYLSKAIFNISNEIEYNLEELNNKSKIAIQVHIYYEDLIDEIINKTNNIPVKFDLFVSINSPKLYDKLKSHIKIYSKANYFEIIIFANKGRDVLPFISQIKTKFKSYKYICHIHSKKSKTVPEIGYFWRTYLFNNLLGNSNIISEILFDFENNKKLGFIFPETFYGIIKIFFELSKRTKKWMKLIFSKLFPDYKLEGTLNFPAGNMFWSKINAIYQIFIYDFSKYYPKEDNQINETIMHGIERIWLYLVKINGFYYKMIFKSF